MSKYEQIMNKVELSEEARQRILKNSEKAAVKYSQKTAKPLIFKTIAAAACFVLFVTGVMKFTRIAEPESSGSQVLSDTYEENALSREQDEGISDASGAETAGQVSTQKDGVSGTSASDRFPITEVKQVNFNLFIIFLVALVISAVGFKMYVYFFSVGYGFSIAGIGAALIWMFRGKMTPAAIVMCLLLIFYGIRLGGYLLIRELRSTSYRKLLKNESKSRVPLGVKCAIWVCCALLYMSECAPLLFRLESGRPDDGFVLAGIILMAVGILCEFLADLQKSRAKKLDPGRFVKTGLYRIVRCPNYFGELLLWTGMLISGLRIYHGVIQWVISLLGYAGIVYVMFSGTRRLEIRQDKNYGSDPDYQEYISRTPILIPLIPLYSVKKHKWLVA